MDGLIDSLDGLLEDAASSAFHERGRAGGAHARTNLGPHGALHGAPHHRPAGRIFENLPRVLFWDPGVVKIGFLAKNIPISPIFIIFRPIFENRDF